MTEQADLFTGARRVFWGYFFLLLDFNFNLGSSATIPLLPNVLGWFFLFRGVDTLSPARPSLALLSPFCTVLGVCSLAQFFPWLEGLSPGWLSLLLAMMTLYTHFQLLTDLAALAEASLSDGDLGKRLRSCRNFLVLSQTALYFSDLFLAATALALLLMAASLCVYVVLLLQLWGFSRDLEEAEELRRREG